MLDSDNNVHYIDFRKKGKTLMNIKYETIVNSLKPLESLIDQKIPIKGAIKIRRAVSAIIPHANDYEDLRKKIINEYAERDDSGEIKVVENLVILKDVEKASSDLKILNETEVLIDIEKINVDKLGDINVEPRILMALEWLFD